MASPNYDAYYNSLVERLQRNYQAGRSTDRAAEERLLGRNEDPIPETATLRIGEIHFYPKENGKNHHTSKFELVEQGMPVLRRGQTFFIALRTPLRPFDESRDFIKLTFNFGPKPSPLNGTKFNLNAEKKAFDRTQTSWACRIGAHDKNAISVEVRIDPNTFVGIWTCSVETRTVRGGGPQYYEYPSDIYILFNPWDTNDQTHMSDPELLNEYILEENGKVWFGPYKTTRGRHWAYGQFDDCVLPLACILLEKSGLPFTSRADPVLISRALSKIVNSQDDDGLLIGRWDEKYEDGVAPVAWTGSVPILEKYFQTLQPVKYGQCWVFSCVLCTVARALGIPCRVVTNYVSAHDTNCSLTVDIYFDDDNQEIDFNPNNPSGGKDSIWNFHVWNDVWMARPDLPAGYGGWQAVDATPQERSDGGTGSFQCGPASLEAVRKGQVGFAYDVPFVLAEVNADLVHWKRDPTTEFGFKRMTCNNYHIGRMIFTKKPNFFDAKGETDREEILAQYKNKEGSRAERLTLVNAARSTRGASQYFQLEANPINDFEFDLIELDKVQIGDSFAVVTKITNKGKETRTVQVDLGAESVYYTGVRAEEVKKATGKFPVAPTKTEELRMTVRPEDYMPKLVEYGIMKITAVCVVDGTSQSWFEEDDFQVIKPILTIEVVPSLKVQEKAHVTFSFRNPLKTKLTKCNIRYEGPGYTRCGTIALKDVAPLEDFKYIHEFIPKQLGTQRWLASFTSVELVDIVGSCVVEIDP